jgi:hypothetical protein
MPSLGRSLDAVDVDDHRDALALEVLLRSGSTIAS